MAASVTANPDVKGEKEVKNEAEEETICILLLGDSLVGKTTFLSRVLLGSSATFNATLPVLRDLDQPFRVDVRTGNKRNKSVVYQLEFNDTSSPDNYTLLQPNVIILCYSVDSRRSLRSVQRQWKPQVETHFNYHERIPVMLLGLRRDLRRIEDEAAMAAKMVKEDGLVDGIVFPQEGLNTAQEMRCDRYAECSAITGQLCSEAFEDIVKMAIATKTHPDGGKTPGWNGCVVS